MKTVTATDGATGKEMTFDTITEAAEYYELVMSRLISHIQSSVPLKINGRLVFFKYTEKTEEKYIAIGLGGKPNEIFNSITEVAQFFGTSMKTVKDCEEHGSVIQGYCIDRLEEKEERS